jgi:hypothetical protein
VIGTAIAVLAAHGVRAAAAPADQQTGEKRARPMRAVQSIGAGGAGRGDDVGIGDRKLALANLRGLP